MGADVSRIRIQEKYHPFDLRGLQSLWAEVKSRPPGLIIIDPLYAYVPSQTDVYRPNEIRALLSQIDEIAKYCGAAVIIVRHLTKTRRDKAIHQGAGPMDIVGVARSAFLVAEHPDDPAVRIMAHVKTNLEKKGASLTFTLDATTTDVPVLVWGDKVYLTGRGPFRRKCQIHLPWIMRSNFCGLN